MDGLDFAEDLNSLLNNPDLRIDHILDRLAGLLNRLDPALLRTAASLQNEDLEAAFLQFVFRACAGESMAETKFLAALVAAAEFKIRADQFGATVLEYARHIRELRGEDDI